MISDYSTEFKLKEILRHSIVYGITSSLQSILGFILLPLLTQYYSPEVFGVYSIIQLIAAASNCIFYLGASSALGRYYFEENNEHYKKQIITASFIISLFGAVSLILLSSSISKPLSIWLFKTDNNALPISLALIGTAFGFLINTMTLILRYQKKSKIFLIITLSGVIINFFVTYIFLTKYHLGILAPIYGIVVSNVFILILLIIINKKIFTLSLSGKYFKLIFIFGIQISFGSILLFVHEMCDRLIINDLLDLSGTGIYSLGYKIASLLKILLVVPFSLIWAPVRMQYSTNTNNNKLVAKVTSYYTIIGLIAIFFASILGEDIIQLLFLNQNYHGATRVFPIIMLSILFSGYQNIFDFGIYLSGKLYYFNIVLIICIIINIGLNYLFIPKFGYIAAAHINMMTHCIGSLIIYFISNTIYKFNLEWKRLLLPICFVYLCSFIPHINYSTLLIKYSIKGIIIIICMYAFCHFWLTHDEKMYALNILSHLKRKKD